MPFVFWRQKGTMMMVEPPSQPVGTGVLKIHNRAFFSSKQGIVKLRACLMGHSDQRNVSFRIELLSVEPQEDRSRRRAIEAVVMVHEVECH
jgi:hypothetical protein